jgi:hypothetical protein
MIYDDEYLGVLVYRPWQRVRRAVNPGRWQYRSDRTEWDEQQARRVEAHAARVATEEARLRGWMPPSKHRPWTEPELELLRAAARQVPSQNALAKQLAPRLGRTMHSVRSALQKYRIIPSGPKPPRVPSRPWTERDLAVLRAELARPVPVLKAARRVSSLLERRMLEVLGMVEAMR